MCCNNSINRTLGTTLVLDSNNCQLYVTWATFLFKWSAVLWNMTQSSDVECSLHVLITVSTAATVARNGYVDILTTIVYKLYVHLPVKKFDNW